MKKIVYLLLVFFIPNIYGQLEYVRKYETFNAIIIDNNFFNQLDSVIDNIFREKYTYYVLKSWDKERMILDYIPNDSDSILYLSITGSDTPLVYGNHKFYDVKYRNKNYFVSIGVEGILISKRNKKIFELSRQTIKNNMYRDMKTPLILIKYHDKELIVEADSRSDKYLVE